MTTREKIEKRLGLPNLDDILEAPTKVKKLIDSMEKLSKDKEVLRDAIYFLETVERLDDKGTLGRLLELLKELHPLATGKTAQAFLEKIDKLEKIVNTLLEILEKAEK